MAYKVKTPKTKEKDKPYFIKEPYGLPYDLTEKGKFKSKQKPKAYLEDDGSLDTIISVSGNNGTKTYRFTTEGRRNIKNLKEEAIEMYLDDVGDY